MDWNAELARQLSGALTFIAFLSSCYLLHWQVRIRPRDRQEWAAMGFIAALCLILGQTMLVYVFSWSFGMGWRGVVSYGLLVISLAFLAVETRRVNLRAGPPRG